MKDVSVGMANQTTRAVETVLSITAKEKAPGYSEEVNVRLLLPR